jgi:hypothetical protein
LEFQSHFFQTLADFCPTRATERDTEPGGREGEIDIKMAKNSRLTATSHNSYCSTLKNFSLFFSWQNVRHFREEGIFY